MPIKKYHDFERKLDLYLFQKDILTESYINMNGAKLITQAEKIINPPKFNGTATKPKK